MKTDAWTKVLNEFKDKERPETVLMVAGNPELLRIVVAWQATVSCRAEKLTKRTGTTEHELWHWLWENAVYSKTDLLNQISGNKTTAEQRFKSLVAGRVLYPDGTLNSFVGKYLRKRVLSLFGLGHKINSSIRANVQ